MCSPSVWLCCAIEFALRGLCSCSCFCFHRLRTGPFEGPATVKPPALPEDTYSKREIPRLCRGGSRSLTVTGMCSPSVWLCCAIEFALRGLCSCSCFCFHRLRTGPFEGP